MPVQFKQVISSFLTWSACEKLAVSATWCILPGFFTLKVGTEGLSQNVGQEITTVHCVIIQKSADFIYFVGRNMKSNIQ
jgi:hypothetical protein